MALVVILLWCNEARPMFEGFLAVTQMVRRKLKNREHFALGCFFSSFQKKYPLDVIFFFSLAFGRPPPDPPAGGAQKITFHKKSRSMDIFTEFYAKNEVVKSVVTFLICDGPFELKFKEVSPIFGGWLWWFDRFLISVTRNFKTRHYPISSSSTFMDKKKT